MSRLAHRLTHRSTFQTRDNSPAKSLTATDTQIDDQVDIPPCATFEARLDGPLMNAYTRRPYRRPLRRFDGHPSGGHDGCPA